MTNLEKIKAAWAMGWSATLESTDDFELHDDHEQVVAYDRNDDSFSLESGMVIGNAIGAKITGYLYAGELAGNDAPDDMQKFMVRKDAKTEKHLAGKIFTVEINDADAVEFVGVNGLIYKSEIEPLFE